MTKSGIENPKLIRRWKIVLGYFIHPAISGSVLAALNNENVSASLMGRTVSAALNRLHGVGGWERGWGGGCEVHGDVSDTALESAGPCHTYTVMPHFSLSSSV